MRCRWMYLLFMLVACSLRAQQRNWLWTQPAGSKGNDQALSLAADGAGNIYAAGYYTDSAVFSGTTIHAAKGTKFFLAKYSPSGVLLWVRTSIAKGQSGATSVCRSQNTYLYLTGYFSDSLIVGNDTLFSAGTAQNLFLGKFDFDGNPSWMKSASVSGGDFHKAIASDESGNAYICGSFSGTATIGTSQFVSAGGSEDIFIAKFSPTGNILWAKQIGATADDAAFAIVAAPSGEFVMTGSFGKTVDFGGNSLTATGTSDIFIAKYSADGNLLWARESGDASGGRGLAIAMDTGGSLYVTGGFSGTTPLDCDGTGNIYIAKYSSVGAKQWTKCEGASGEEIGNAIAINKSGNIIIAGDYDAPLDLGNGELPFDSIFDAFVAEMSPAGAAIWADHAGGGGGETGNAVVTDSTGNIYLAGGFAATGHFGNVTLDSKGLSDIYISKIGARSSVSDPHEINEHLTLFPNPASTAVNVLCSDKITGKKTIEIYSILGESLKKIVSSEKQIIISINDLPKGVYLCRISAPGISLEQTLIRD